MLNSQQKQRIREGFADLKCNPDELVFQFYLTLFDLAPELRRLFKEDLRVQSGKLQRLLVLLVQTLDHLDMLLPEIRALGARHAGYGVEDPHYDVVETALLRTFAMRIQGWTDADAGAWRALYRVAADAARDGARQSRAGVGPPGQGPRVGFASAPPGDLLDRR